MQVIRSYGDNKAVWDVEAACRRRSAMYFVRDMNHAHVFIGSCISMLTIAKRTCSFDLPSTLANVIT
jgi:hypothetical protein